MYSRKSFFMKRTHKDHRSLPLYSLLQYFSQESTRLDRLVLRLNPHIISVHRRHAIHRSASRRTVRSAFSSTAEAGSCSQRKSNGSEISVESCPLDDLFLEIPLKFPGNETVDSFSRGEHMTSLVFQNVNISAILEERRLGHDFRLPRRQSFIRRRDQDTGNDDSGLWKLYSARARLKLLARLDSQPS